MKKINDGDLTIISLNANLDFFEEYDPENDYPEIVHEKAVEYIDELSKNNFFFDRLKIYINENKERLECEKEFINDEDFNNLDKLFNFIKICYNNEGIKNNKKRIFTLTTWK